MYTFSLIGKFDLIYFETKALKTLDINGRNKAGSGMVVPEQSKVLEFDE